MKNKKGFTLIEIIICIGLIVLIGTSSIVGFKIISNKNLITKLDGITDKAIEAAQVYIETNDTAYNQLYNNKNGVKLPLQLLVNEGLLNLDGTDLTETDIKKHYVATFLGGTGSSENCQQMANITSWGSDKAIYFCMNGNGSSNLAVIDPTKYGNKTQISNEPYYFTGINPDNYAKISGSIKITQKYTGRSTTSETEVDLIELIVSARIYAIDRNDDILVAVTLSSAYNDRYCYKYKESDTYNCSSRINSTDILFKSSTSGFGQEKTWLMTASSLAGGGYEYQAKYHYIFRLPNTCKITSGTGMEDNKFEITC